MSASNRKWFEGVFWCLFFCQMTLVQNQCIDNNLNLSNEEDSYYLTEYLEKLEFYTGLSRTKPSIPVSCPNSICFINSDGPAIWEARLNFYTPYVLNSTTDSRSLTLDGCICHSANYNSFQRCMQDVRRKMLNELDTKMLQDFRKIVESDGCRSYEENCHKPF